MIVKKKNLIIACVITVVLFIVGTISITTYVTAKKEKREQQERKEKFNRAVDREYKNLVQEYNSIVDVIKDYDYSTSFRYKYVKKLNELLGSSVYELTGSEATTVWRCFESLDKERDMKMLKSVAEINVLLGVD